MQKTASGASKSISINTTPASPEKREEHDNVLKVRLMGTRRDIRWFRKLLEREKKVEVVEFSEPYSIKGSSRFFRVYVEVRQLVKDKQDCQRR